MLKITFYPESDKAEFIKAAKEYQDIWDSEGEKIIETMERISGLRFVEKFINAIVYEWISFSFPLRLRASYPLDIKKATLIHELGHRLLAGNKITKKGKNFRALEIHKPLYLILYDIWVNLYGEDFAKKNVKIESERHEDYKEAWEWVLSFDKETRTKKFTELTSKSLSN